jgi:ATP-dependent exoDNAse (exonuclease V) alpha subunit
VIGFAKIIATRPSDVGAMSAHLLNNTLGRGVLADIAAYYERGGGPEPLIVELARDVATGELAYSEALAELVQDWLREGGDAEQIDAAEDRLGRRLEALAGRFVEGDDLAHLAVIRPDIHPAVLVGLGIEPDGVLTLEEINALLAGRRADGDLVEGKTYATERQLPEDPKDGVRRWSTPIGSYDFCPTPDKTVSVAWAFASPAEQAAIYWAHLEAAREAVAYIASEVGVARVGKGGQEGTEKGHVAWLEFTHHTARRVAMKAGPDGNPEFTDEGSAGDPDLHTHFLIPNAVFCESGRVGSLDTAAIRGFIFEADAYYHATLGQKLRDAGFDIALDERTGAARMTAIPEMVRTLFSKRSMTGENLARQYTEARGEVWDQLSDDQRQARIKQATQGPAQKQKGEKDPVADIDDWKRQAREAGWVPPPSLQLYGPPLPRMEGEALHRAAYDVALPWLADRLEHKAVVPHWDLRVAALRGMVEHGITGTDDIDAVTKMMREEGVAQYGNKTALVWGQEENRRYTSVTTALHERDEMEFVALAKGAAADHSGDIPQGLLQRKIRASGLDFSDTHGGNQRRAIEKLGQGGRFGVVIAAAGAGKTTALKPLVAAWKDQERDVWGASLAWRQADDLVDAGIARHRVRAFSVLLKGIRDGSVELTRNSVVAVDEWGLLGTRQGLELLREQARVGFSVVALGDDKQCSSIEAGAIIDLSRRALGAEAIPVIVTTRRQESAREKQIVGLLRDGKAAEALTMKRQDGTAEMAYGGPDGVIARVAKLYGERLAATGEAPSISAPTNADAHRISEAVRAERRAVGLVGADLITIRATDGTRDYDMKLAKGDHVRLFKSTGAKYARGQGGAIGRNGSVLEVVEANSAGLKLRARNGRVGTIAWESLDRNGRSWLAYGTAMTIHTAQGSTAKEHIFALPLGAQAVTGAAGYTASTRHRSVSYLVTSELAERMAVRESRPLNDPHDITVDDKWANVARALAYQPEQDSALAMMGRVLSLRRGAVSGFRAATADTGAPRSDAADNARQRHLGAVLAGEARAVTAGLRKGFERAQQAYTRVTDGQFLRR